MAAELNPNPQAVHSNDAAPQQRAISPRKALVGVVVFCSSCVYSRSPASCIAYMRTPLWQSAPMLGRADRYRAPAKQGAPVIPLSSPAM